METVNSVLQWFLMSSADPKEVSLTVRGVLVGMIPIVMTLVGFTHLNVGVDGLNSLVDGFVTFLQALLALIAAAMTLYGIFRKLIKTVYTR